MHMSRNCALCGAKCIVVTILQMLVVETLHCLGLVLIFFHVMPHFGSIDNAGIMYLIFLIPASLKLLFSYRGSNAKADDNYQSMPRSQLGGRNNNDNRGETTASAKQPPRSEAVEACCTGLATLLDLAAVLLQVGGIAAVLYSRKEGYGSYRFASHSALLESRFNFSSRLYWQIPLGLVLISVKWWENFVDQDRGPFKLHKLRMVLDKVRPKIDVAASLVAIGSLLGYLYLLDWAYDMDDSFKSYLKPKLEARNYTIQEILNTNYNRVQAVNYVLTVTPSLVQISTAIICYYFATLACKLMMQRFCFCLPLYLAPVATVIVIYLQCDNQLPLLPTTAGLQFEFVCHFDSGFENSGWFVFGGCLWLASALWVTGHVWFPKEERLALLEK